MYDNGPRGITWKNVYFYIINMYKLNTSFTLCPWNFSIHIFLGRTINKTQLRTHKSVAYFLYFLLFMYPLTSKYFLESDVPVSLHPLVFLIFHISLYSLIFHISLYSLIFLYLCILSSIHCILVFCILLYSYISVFSSIHCILVLCILLYSYISVFSSIHCILVLCIL